MAPIDVTLKEAMEIGGALGVAIVDVDSGALLGAVGGGPASDLASTAAGNAAVARARMAELQSRGQDEAPDDVLIALDSEVHLLRRVGSVRGGGLFLYLALDRRQADVEVARRQLGTIEAELSV